MTIRVSAPFIALALLSGRLTAQAPAGPLEIGDKGREACVMAHKADDERTAKRLADSLDVHYRRLIEAHPRDVLPRVGLARLLGECRMALTGFMSKGRVFDEGVQLANDALAIAPKDWGARFVLAQFYYNAPDFLGHRKDAIRELETILRDHDGKAYFDEMATPYRMLGDLYVKEKRNVDATAVWRKGAALFPNNAALKSRLVKADSARSQ